RSAGIDCSRSVYATPHENVNLQTGEVDSTHVDRINIEPADGGCSRREIVAVAHKGVRLRRGRESRKTARRHVVKDQLRLSRRDQGQGQPGNSERFDRKAERYRHGKTPQGAYNFSHEIVVFLVRVWGEAHWFLSL